MFDCRNYLHERRGAQLIVYLSKGTLIRGGGSFTYVLKHGTNQNEPKPVKTSQINPKPAKMTQKMTHKTTLNDPKF